METPLEDPKSKFQFQETTLKSPIMESFAMLDGLIFWPGTVIPILSRYGPTVTVRNLRTGDSVILDESGSLKLQKGDILEVVELQSQERPRRMSYGQISVQDLKKYMGSHRKKLYSQSSSLTSKSYGSFTGGKQTGRKFVNGVKTLQSLFSRGSTVTETAIDLDNDINTSTMNTASQNSTKSTVSMMKKSPSSNLQMNYPKSMGNILASVNDESQTQPTSIKKKSIDSISMSGLISRAFSRYKGGSKTVSTGNLTEFRQSKVKLSIPTSVPIPMQESVSDNIKEELDNDGSDPQSSKTDDMRRADSSPIINRHNSEIGKPKVVILEEGLINRNKSEEDEKHASNSSIDQMPSSLGNGSLSIVTSMGNLAVINSHISRRISEETEEMINSDRTPLGNQKPPLESTDSMLSYSTVKAPEKSNPSEISKAGSFSDTNNLDVAPKLKSTTVLLDYIDKDQTSRRPSQIEYTNAGPLKFESEEGSMVEYYFTFRDEFLWAYVDQQTAMKEGKPVFRFPLEGAIAIQDNENLNALLLINGGKIKLVAESIEDKIKWLGSLNSMSNNISTSKTFNMQRMTTDSPTEEGSGFWSADYLDERSSLHSDMMDYNFNPKELASIGIVEEETDMILESTEMQLLEESRDYYFTFERKIVSEPFSSSIEPKEIISESQENGGASSNWSLAKQEEKIVSENEAKQYELRDSSSLTQPTDQSAKKTLLRRISSLDGHQLVYRIDEDSEKGIITAGTLKKLLEALVDEIRPDTDYIDVFLLCHRHIISAEDLMVFFLKRLNMILPEEASEPLRDYMKKWQPVIILRIVTIVRYWVEKHFVDFKNDRMRHLFQLFAVSLKNPRLVLRQDEDQSGYTSCLMDFRRLAVLIQKIFQKQETLSSPNGPVVNQSRPKKEFLDIDVHQLKKALIFVQHEKFRSIQPYEFILNLWGDQKSDETIRETKPLMDLIDYFNTVSLWVVTEIVTQPVPKNRTTTIERFIKLAKECRKLNNFNLVVAIVSGLNNSSVARLKQSWENVQQKYQNYLKDMEQLVSPEMNYRNYRSALESIENAKEKTCCTPFIGLFIKDLVFLNDGNPKTLENGLINFGKLSMIHAKIMSIVNFQSLRYNVTVEDDLINYAKTLRALKDSVVYKYSLLCESKNGEERLIDKWAKENK